MTFTPRRASFPIPPDSHIALDEDALVAQRRRASLLRAMSPFRDDDVDVLLALGDADAISADAMAASLQQRDAAMLRDSIMTVML